MSVKEVTQLRKAGKLKEAFMLAKQEFKEERNAWTAMSMFWVLRDMALNLFIPNNQLSMAQKCLDYMRLLLPEMIDESGIGEKALLYLSRQLQPNAALLENAAKLSKTDPTAAYLQVVEVLGNAADQQLDESQHEEWGWIIYRYLKANMETLESVQIRRLLHDYMLLSNERPSMLHSTILNFAMNFSKTHSDFVFFNFLMMWGINNFRKADFSDTQTDEFSIPSLISRICKTLIEHPAKLDVQTLIDSFEKPKQMTIIEHLRSAVFWKIMNQQKNGDTDEQLCVALENYAYRFASFPGSHWHSEILKLANRFIPETYGIRYFSLVRNWYGKGNFQHEDWQKNVMEEGKEYPSLVVKTAKRCFEVLKMNDSLRKDITQIEWLMSLYQAIYAQDSDDDWSIRIYATLCKWSGRREETIQIYKKLLFDMGEKYYLWSELAACTEEEENTIRIGLLLKALKLERNEDFLGNIHLELAEAWIHEDFGGNARIELDAYLQHRNEKGWSVSESYNHLKKVLENVADSKCNHFQTYIQQAEDFVYSDYEWKDFVLTERWTQNGVNRCSFSDGQSHSFVVKTKRFPYLNQAQLGEIWSWRCGSMKNTETIPLVTKKSPLKRWSLLSLQYGVVDYVNIEKKTLHIVTCDHRQVWGTMGNQAYQEGEWVRFRKYQKEYKNEKITRLVDLKKCSSEGIKNYMPSDVVIVDDVNEVKQLFHVYLHSQKLGGSIKHKETSLRPQIGDFLRINYYIKLSKDGNKYLKILDAIPTNETVEGVEGRIEGYLHLKYKDNNAQKEEPDYGFVNEYYVHKKLLTEYHITEDCKVTARIIRGTDQRWKVYDLIVLEE